LAAGWGLISRRRGLGWWLALGTVTLTVCVAAAFVALLSSVAGLQGAAADQQAAGHELTVAHKAQDDVTAMDTAVHGFALTRDRPFLESYYAAKQGFAHDSTVLAAAERQADGKVDPSTHAIARAMLSYERSYAGRLIQLIRKRPLSRSELRDLTALGAVRLHAVLARFTAQTATSSGDARQRLLRAQAAAASTRRFAISGLVALVVLVIGFALAIRRGIGIPLMRLRGSAERLTHGDRGLRMPRSRLRELDDLGCSFDSMADAITAGREKLEDQNQTLEERVRARTSDLEAARVEILTRLARAAEYRDDATQKHTERVARTTRLLAPHAQAEYRSR
jgi:CHASE3 domain sensor protein